VKRFQGLALNLFVAAVSTTLFGAALEVLCRLTEDTAPARPTAAYITQWMEGGDAFFTVKSTAVGWPPWEDYNHDGVRDRAHALEKPEGVRRLMCVGDSVTLGYGIEPHEAYPQVLQDLLAAQALPVEVFNVSLGGWSTRQQLIAYRRICRKYGPDQVLLGVCLNDIPEMGNNLTRPSPWLMELHRRSALVRRAVRAQDREIRDVEEMFAAPDSAKVQGALERTFADIRKLRDETRADGAELAVLIFPFRFQTAGGAPPPVVQERIATFCRESGIPCLDLLPALRAAGPESFHDYDHFSASGARIVAEEVVRSGLVAGARPSGEEVPADKRDIARLLQDLESGEPGKRAAAAWALGRMGPEARGARTALTLRVRDNDANVRWRAMTAIATLGVDRDCCLTGLLEALAQEGGPGRAEAAQLVGKIGADAREAAPLLAQSLRDSREEVRAQAAVALGLVGPGARSAVPALVAAFDDPTIRWQVADALGRIGPDAPATAVLVRGLADPSSSVRWRSAGALAQMPSLAPETTEALASVAGDPSENVRLAALKGLARANAPPALLLPIVRRGLSDPDTRVRAKAVELLGRLAPVGAREEIERLTGDPDSSVQEAARNAARKLGSR
jgi:HEAT repeat protein/lysophospholipase L1-like esterase